MWVFTNTAFISAVRHRDKPDSLMVRARLPGDLERFFGPDGADLAVQETRDADYRYRCTVSDAVFASALLRAAGQIDYPNFKDSIGPDDQMRHHAYLDVWAAMHRVQDQGAH
ncbi:hypothetical protein [Aquisediminimonas profunda]|uniref:hypothetical protein n=1 Tax=Aquisediminimonas profunda TaxID=1550733 RepID=UPI001C6369E1|nr:hypothetical protein [Aquisediminimonas profunda]